ncbi:hypothetical protein [Dolichospermum phage Dfl-JY45]
MSRRREFSALAARRTGRKPLPARSAGSPCTAAMQASSSGYVIATCSRRFAGS